MSKRSNGVKFNIEAIKDAELRGYVRQLSTSLDKQNQELRIQSQKNNIYQELFKSDNLTDFLDRLAKALTIKGYSSLRILVKLNKLSGQKKIIGQSGNETIEYAYLDEQIFQQLKDKKQLIVPDTAKIHSIKFNPDKKYPKTIYAYQFLQTTEAHGCFWITFEKVKDFSAFELELYQHIASTLGETVNQTIKNENIFQQTEINKSLLELTGIPVVTLTEDRKIISTNIPDIKKVQEWVEKICSNNNYSEWEMSKKDDLYFEMQIDEKHYQIIAKKIETLNSKVIVIILKDDSTVFSRESYLKMIIDTISHDFRSPLINMQGFSKLLSMVGDMNEKQAEYLDSIQDSIENLLTVVENLANVSRLNNEGGLKVIECETREIIESAMALIHAEARQKRIEFEVKHSLDKKSVTIDRVLVVSAIYNLMKNAVANSRIGGTVILDEKIADENWVIFIKDQGKGISQIDIEKLEKNHFVSKGGRGLSIVDQIARFHKGNLKVRSELGNGSTFIFEIPAG